MWFPIKNRFTGWIKVTLSYQDVVLVSICSNRRQTQTDFFVKSSNSLVNTDAIGVLRVVWTGTEKLICPKAANTERKTKDGGLWWEDNASYRGRTQWFHSQLQRHHHDSVSATGQTDRNFQRVLGATERTFQSSSGAGVFAKMLHQNCVLFVVWQSSLSFMSVIWIL